MKKIVRKILNLLEGLFCLGLMIFGVINRKKKKIFFNRYITPLYFHNPNKTVFEKCIKYLKRNNYVFISTKQLIDSINGKSIAPKGAVWISFDDGWKENIDNVIPIIKKYKIQVTFFISTDPVENTGVFWRTYIEKYKENLPGSYKNNTKKLWNIDEKKRKEIIEKIANKFNNKIEREAMTVNDIKYISDIPEITIGSHTIHHFITPNCTDEELEYEIKKSKYILENWIGKEVKYFAYPFGDFSGREKRILIKYGFEMAATTRKSLIYNNEDLYFIPRFGVSDNYILLPRFLSNIVGIWTPLIKKIKELIPM